MTPMV